jgi:hypothetical protein
MTWTKGCKAEKILEDLFKRKVLTNQSEAKDIYDDNTHGDTFHQTCPNEATFRKHFNDVKKTFLTSLISEHCEPRRSFEDILHVCFVYLP